MESRKTQIDRCTSFPPIAAADARALVLGSMPSVASLAKQQYYGHPRNAFWSIMGRLFGAGPELAYDARKRALEQCGVAVWDVLRSCRRAGSLDSSIVPESEMPNDFVSFFQQHGQIGTVFFNGQKAEEAFGRHVRLLIHDLESTLCFVRLPSTSPAHAGRTFDEKLAAWQAVRLAVENQDRSCILRR